MGPRATGGQIWVPNSLATWPWGPGLLLWPVSGLGQCSGGPEPLGSEVGPKARSSPSVGRNGSQGLCLQGPGWARATAAHWRVGLGPGPAGGQDWDPGRRWTQRSPEAAGLLVGGLCLRLAGCLAFQDWC